MSTAVAQPGLRVAFAGAFRIRLAERVRAFPDIPCDVTLADEAGIMAELPDVDVLVTMAFTHAMGAAGRRLKLVQVPGAGLDRIDRSALPTGTWLANVYGHEIGIAEYVIGAMLALTRDFARLDASLRQGHWESQWAVSSPPPAPWPELAGKTLGILELPNVLMTPHVSGWTEGMLEARAKVIAENIHRAAQGEPPVNLIPASAE
jgi:phosphoglycerate dehydrogenase-like enzyme